MLNKSWPSKCLAWVKKRRHVWLDKNFDPSLLTNKLWLVFMRLREKKIWKKNSKWPTQKNWDFQNRHFSMFFSKNLWIGPWVGTINWGKGHWCGSTYMALRLFDISSKTGKKCIFGKVYTMNWQLFFYSLKFIMLTIFGVFRPFLSLFRTASRPYRLSHINAFCINQF